MFGGVWQLREVMSVVEHMHQREDAYRRKIKVTAPGCLQALPLCAAVWRTELVMIERNVAQPLRAQECVPLANKQRAAPQELQEEAEIRHRDKRKALVKLQKVRGTGPALSGEGVLATSSVSSRLWSVPLPRPATCLARAVCLLCGSLSALSTTLSA